MSTASMASLEDPYPFPDASLRERNTSPTDYGRALPHATHGKLSQSANGNYSASNTHQRTDTAGSSVSRTGSRPPPRRNRTYSQPYAYDGPMQNGHAPGGKDLVNGLPTPESSRSTSPLYQQQLSGRPGDIKPTRIPVVVRGRTPSMSSYGTAVQNGRNSDVSRHGPYSSPPVGTQQDLWPVNESGPSHNSSSTVLSSQRQRPGTANEPTSFRPSSKQSNASARPHEDPGMRRSTDSEERPFEHWYRGDVRRNGGVGELRVGAKQEMLDIANYGHRYGAGGNSKPASREASTSRGIPQADEFPSRRKRAGSVTDMGARESFYMDEERARELSNVLNEDPLTDLEGDGDPDTSTSFTDHDTPIDNGYSSTTLAQGFSPHHPEDIRSVTPTNNRSLERERNAPQTRIPAPVPRQSSEPPQSQTQTPTPSSYRVGSEPPASPPSPNSSTSVNAVGRAQASRAGSAPPSAATTEKRRAKSPAAPSVSKKPKKSSSRTKIDEEKNRRSVAVYPEPLGDNIMDAIPSWTVPKGGNWDEVSNF